MTPDTNMISERMTSVKAACDKAPSGPRKDAAMKLYRVAEKAHSARNDAETNKALDAASAKLA